MVSDSDLLPAVNLIYQSVLEPESWPAALGAVNRLLHSEHSILFTDETLVAPFGLGVTAGLSEAHAARFLSPETAALWKPWQEFMPKARFLPTWQYVSNAEMERSDMFQMVVRPTNGYHGLCMQQETADLSYHMAICRPRQYGPHSLEEAERAQTLEPHLTTALRLQQRLAQSESRLPGLITLLDRLSDGAILIDEAGRPVFLNSAAAAMLDTADVLRLGVGGALRAASPQDSERLGAAIAAVLRSPASPANLRIESTEGTSQLQLSLFPIERIEAHMPGTSPPRIAMFVRETAATAKIDQAILRNVFNLTAREGETAALLAAGLAPIAIAARLGLTVGTVRFNIKRIFDKTGVHSQAALVALVLGTAS